MRPRATGQRPHDPVLATPILLRPATPPGPHVFSDPRPVRPRDPANPGNKLIMWLAALGRCPTLNREWARRPCLVLVSCARRDSTALPLRRTAWPPRLTAFAPACNSLSLSLSLSLALAHSLALALTLTLSLSPSLPLSISVYLFPSLSLLSLLLCLSVCFSLFLPLCLCLLFLFLFLSLSGWLSLSLAFSLSPSLSPRKAHAPGWAAARPGRRFALTGGLPAGFRVWVLEG